MTSQSPRIYLYKITFEEVPYYYYGVHKERTFNEEYWGSPITNGWCWKLYTPKKQILQLFEFNDIGWLKAQEIETRIIKLFYNKDKWCLNENCGGLFSLKVCSNAGRIGGKKTKELGVGLFGLSVEQRSEHGKKVKELGLGMHGFHKEERIKNSKRGGDRSKELGVGVHGRTKEQMIEDGKMGGKIGGKLGGIIMNSQRWMCEETGHITTPAALTIYQKNRGIDTSKRIRIS